MCTVNTVKVPVPPICYLGTSRHSSCGSLVGLRERDKKQRAGAFKNTTTTGGGEQKMQTQKRFLSICLVAASMLLSKVRQSDLPWLPRTRPEPHRWLKVRVVADAAGLPGIRGSSMPNIFMRNFGVFINSIPEYDG